MAAKAKTRKRTIYGNLYNDSFMQAHFQHGVIFVSSITSYTRFIVINQTSNTFIYIGTPMEI